MTDQDKCDSTTWLFSGLRNTAAVELINLGQIGENAKAKSDRLSVTVNCSLVIKKVTVEDVGCYSCRQFNRSGQRQDRDAKVYLSVINSEYLHHFFKFSAQTVFLEQCTETLQ